MNKIIKTDKAPSPIGPYNQAIKANNTLYISGCLGLDPVSGLLEEGITNQAKKAMDNLVAILKEEDLTTSNLVKTTVFLTDMNNFGAFNEIYATYFDGTYFPARTCVEISKLPKNGLIEIEAIAAK